MRSCKCEANGTRNGLEFIIDFVCRIRSERCDPIWNLRCCCQVPILYFVCFLSVCPPLNWILDVSVVTLCLERCFVDVPSFSFLLFVRIYLTLSVCTVNVLYFI